jgi:hypothetical protein
MNHGTVIRVAADGTGDYLTIQDGINAVPAHGIVEVKATGSYPIASSIVLPDKALTLTTSGGRVTVQCTANVHGFTCTGRSDITINGDWEIIGSSGAAWSEHGIRIVGESNNIVVDGDLVIHEFGGVGVLVDGASTNILIRGVEAYNTRAHGIAIQGGATADVQNCVAHDTGLVGIMIHGAHATVSGSEVYNVGDNGIYVDWQSDGTIIRNCQSHDNTANNGGSGGKGLLIKANDVLVEDVEVWNCRSGLLFDQAFDYGAAPASHCVARRVNAYDNWNTNLGTNNGAYDIEFDDCIGNGAQAIEWGGDGINIDGASTGINIHDSTFLNNVRWDIGLFGSGTVTNCTYNSCSGCG